MEQKEDQQLNLYLEKRNNIFKLIHKQKYGDMIFSEEEENANQIFRKRISQARFAFPPDFYREYSLKYTDLIEKSDVFNIVKRMPKGGVLHIHLDCCFDVEWIVQKCLSPNCYVNLADQRWCYREKDPGPGFKQLLKLREEAEDQSIFDAQLRESVQINLKDVQNEGNIWELFEIKILKLSQFLSFKDHFYEHILNLSRGFIREGIFHLEARQFLNHLTDEEGNPIGIEAEIAVYRKAIAEIRKQCPHFTLKIIVQGLKVLGLDKIEENLKSTIDAAKKHPDLIVGYDLEEDKFKQTIDFIEVLLKKEKFEAEAGVTLPFVFHGGESLKFIENDNLFDLLLLKSKRIGHGLNLAKHSYLMEIFREQNTAIEINPLSNQILDYVYDLRLHPAITYHNYGLRIVINSDDPGLFKTNYINYDFFVCAIAMEFDLKDFKRICRNSLECSLLSPVEMTKALEIWQQEWDLFTKSLLTY